MDAKEFRVRGKEMVDYIADYLENIRERKVFPNKKPGFLKKQIPDTAPNEPQSWIEIFEDVETIIMPGVTHWQSPHMHAYFPALNSYPSLLGEMLADAIGSLGFTWASSPACTELEMVVMNWLAKMIGLPEHFLHKTTGQTGGGVIQPTASEATLVCLLAGRTKALKYYKSLYPEETNIINRLVGYCSDQAHSSVEKAALIGLVNIRFVESDGDLSMRGEALEEAISNDRKAGLLPFYVCASLGTTGACAFDNLVEIGKVCQKENLWLHVDAAYAGSAFICPEFRTWMNGIEYADSLAFNPSKWLMVNFECTAMWVKDSIALHETFNVDPLYLQHEYSGLAIDFMHWQIPLSKKFRALKLWFVIRNYGVEGLQKHIRHGVSLAQKFESFIKSDSRFEIPAKRHLGMVVFRLVGDNQITEQLWKRLNSRRNIHLVPSSFKGKYVIRFTVTSPRTTIEDIIRDWKEIETVATGVLDDLERNKTHKVPLGDIKKKNENFGTSLLLANSPMSPKIVNGSFAAIYDHVDVLEQYSKTIRLRQNAQDSPAMRRRIKGILMSGKQFSLDSRLDLFHGLETTSNRNSMVDAIPLIEDEENISAVSDSSLERVSPDYGNGLLEVPIPRRIRSKSVDHQFSSNVEKFKTINKTKVCTKCGHDMK